MYYLCDFVNLTYLKAVKTARDASFAVYQLMTFSVSICSRNARAPVFECDSNVYAHAHQNTRHARSI